MGSYDPATRTVEEREVTIGVANWEYTEILNGLSAGDQIVTTIDREGLATGAVVEPE